MNHIKTLMVAAAAVAFAAGATAQTRGVTDSEIRIGGAHDLSGVFAAISTPAVNGANLYFDMVNANGGVHGRQIRYIVEDHGYQLPRATQAFNKLIERDQVFAMLLNLGTPHNLAHYPLMERRQVPNLLPLTAARQILPDPPGLNYTMIDSYWREMVEGLRYINEQHGLTQVCSMYLPTDFGEEVAAGSKDGAEMHGLTFVAETTHRPDEQDFVGALTRLRSEGCEVVTIALGIRATITVVGTAKRLGWDDAKFLVSSAGFHEAVAGVPGGVTDGLYGAASWVDLLSRRDEPVPAEFIAAYEERFGHPAGGFAMLGYAAAEITVKALEAAGPDLTLDSFIEAMNGIDYHNDLLDTQISYTDGSHQGANTITISVVEEGYWRLLERL